MKLPHKTFHYLAIATAILATYIPFNEAHDSLIPPAHGQDYKVSLLPQRTITLPGVKVTKYPAEALPTDTLVSVLQKAGFTGDKLTLAYAVARAESSGRPKALNLNTKSGDASYGILQINMKGRLGPARRKQFGLKTNDDLFDPLVNAKVAYAMSGGGTNWTPWGAFRNGHYLRHLADL